MISCIYAITNTATGEQYIGATIDLQRRMSEHNAYLRNQSHHSKKLQEAWQTQPLVINVLEEVEDLRTLAERERYWQEKRFEETGSHGYNSPNERPYQLTDDLLRQQESQSIQRAAFASDEEYTAARAEMRSLQRVVHKLGYAMNNIESPIIRNLQMFKRFLAVFDAAVGVDITCWVEYMPPLDSPLPLWEAMAGIHAPLDYESAPDDDPHQYDDIPFAPINHDNIPIVNFDFFKQRQSNESEDLS